MNSVELYGCLGCGSAVVEAALEWAGVEFTYREVESWEPGPAIDALKLTGSATDEAKLMPAVDRALAERAR